MSDLLTVLRDNIVLMTALTAWFTAQFIKSVAAFWKHSEFKVERLTGAGGMPSSHTSLVVSLVSAVGYKSGLSSPDFAIAFVLAGIVMYDATGVRRAAGKQAKVINKLVRELRAEQKINEASLKELIGHTPMEVLVGAMLGFAMAFLFHRFY